MIATTTATTLLLQQKYILMIPLLFFAQPIVGMAAGALVGIGEIDFFVVYALLVGSALISDIVWYFIGHHYGESFISRFGKYVSVNTDQIGGIKDLFHKYHGSILFLSKLVNGMGLAIGVVFTAGLSRIKFFPFLLFNLAGEMMWSGIIIGIGYFFGSAYMAANGLLEKIFLIVPFMIVVALFLGFTRYLSQRIQGR